MLGKTENYAVFNFKVKNNATKGYFNKIVVIKNGEVLSLCQVPFVYANKYVIINSKLSYNECCTFIFSRTYIKGYSINRICIKREYTKRDLHTTEVKCNVLIKLGRFTRYIIYVIILIGQ